MDRRRGSWYRYGFSRLFPKLGQTLHKDVADRDEKDADRGRDSHAKHDRSSHWIHLSICRKEAAFLGMHLAIGADEFADRFALVEGLRKHGRKALRGGKVLFLAEREDYL